MGLQSSLPNIERSTMHWDEHLEYHIGQLPFEDLGFTFAKLPHYILVLNQDRPALTKEEEIT
jgi:hypothetical protein